ncbi:MAG TPA: tetratricopeptide repeat protein [Terriglobales bacterium]|nr:tetratricopeptide repeat protein [Terriglobales bacterium]
MEPLPNASNTTIAVDGSDQSLRWYASREPLILLVLSTLAVVSFLAVSGLSRIYFAQQKALGEKWFRRATQNAQQGRLEQAVEDFQTAELYSVGNFNYEFGLAKTFAALNRTDEALSYLVNLREQQPDNAQVNLEVARIYAKQGDENQALRYYHNAIYAVWPSDADTHRRAARLELVEFLLRQNDPTQAQAELIAMSANMPANSPLHGRAGELFLQVPDYEHALAEFRVALKLDPHDAAALAGAGRAAFELANYSSARRYLEAAVAANRGDSSSADLLKLTSLVIELDPYPRSLTPLRRSQIAVEAFEIAGDRLRTCDSTEKPYATLDTRWREMKPQVNERRLQKNPVMVDEVMNLVFAIEKQTADKCAPNQKDRAILLIAKMHEGSER